jgi:oligoribonuclease
MPKSPSHLVWIDLETTGINDRTCSILEIATIITDKDLEIVEEGPSLIIHQPDGILKNMEPWCVDQHGGSGLTEASRQSKVSLADAEEQTLTFVRKHCLRGQAPMCGNSIGFDRRFIMHHMPKLNDYLDFRNVDVSSLKELVYRWYPGVVEKVVKKSTHRSLADIRESIEEMRFYRQHVFRVRAH